MEYLYLKMKNKKGLIMVDRIIEYFPWIIFFIILLIAVSFMIIRLTG